MELLKNPLILGAAAVGRAVGAAGVYQLGCSIPWVIAGGAAGAIIVPVVLFYAIMSNFRM